MWRFSLCFVLDGLISVVGSLTKAFIQFGISLLANPIFLLVAAIVAIVAVIALVMNKLGILKPILNAVGKVFGWIGDAIDMVVQAFKDLCDWLGLSNNAAEDAADKQAAAAEKTAAAYEEKSKSVVSGFDREIEMAKLDGKNTVYMEKQKQYWLLKTAENIFFQYFKKKFFNQNVAFCQWQSMIADMINMLQFLQILSRCQVYSHK